MESIPTPSGSEAAGSEVDILARGESLGDAALEDDAEASEAETCEVEAKTAELKVVDKSEHLPQDVPPGKFWLHDDRFDDDAGRR